MLKILLASSETFIHFEKWTLYLTTVHLFLLSVYYSLLLLMDKHCSIEVTVWDPLQRPAAYIMTLFHGDDDHNGHRSSSGLESRKLQRLWGTEKENRKSCKERHSQNADKQKCWVRPGLHILSEWNCGSFTRVAACAFNWSFSLKW